MRQLFSRLLLMLVIITLFLGTETFAATNDTTMLTLSQAEEQALAHDDSLKAAKINMETAKSAFESAARPIKVTGNFSIIVMDPDPPATMNMDNPSFTEEAQINTKWHLTGAITLKDHENDYSLSYTPFNLSYELGMKSSAASYLAKIQAYETARLNLIVQVRNVYGEAFKNDTLYKLAQENLELTKEHFRQANVLFEVGKISKLDLMETEQQVKAAEVKLSAADLNKAASFLKLGTLLGKDLLTGVSLNVDNISWAEADRIDIEGSIAKCLKDAPDIKAISVNIEIAKINYMMDSYYHLKNLTLSASDKVISGQFEQNTKSLSLQISGPLDDTYFKDKAESKMNLDAALLQLKIATTTRQSMILDALRLWKMAELGLGPAKEAINIAKERLRIINLKYDNGMASGSEVIQTRQALSQAEEAYWQSWQSLQQAREGFYQAVWGEPVLKQE